MKPIDINFVGGRLRSLRPREQYLFAKIIVVVGLACLLWLVSTLIAHLIEGQRLTEAVRQTEHILQAKQIATTGSVKVPLPDSQIKSLNDAVSALNLPWRDLFDALEDSNSPDVALVSLHADGTTNQIFLVAESNKSASLLEYAFALKSQPIFSVVLPVSHEENTHDTNMPLRIQLNARWGR